MNERNNLERSGVLENGFFSKDMEGWNLDRKEECSGRTREQDQRQEVAMTMGRWEGREINVLGLTSE